MQSNQNFMWKLFAIKNHRMHISIFTQSTEHTVVDIYWISSTPTCDLCNVSPLQEYLLLIG